MGKSMSAQSRMSKRKTSKGSRNATFLQGSQAGRSLFDSLDGPTTAPSGLEVAPVNPSPPPESDGGPPTNGISGPHSSVSSRSADLQSSLANKLRARFGTDGSMEYRQTWKERVTPAGITYWEHTASARRTSDSDCSGWPTPQSHDTQEQGKGRLLTETGRIQCHNGDSHSLNLPGVAQLAGWPTPMAGSPATENYNEAGNTDFSRKCVSLVIGWNTPRATDGSNGGPNQAGGALPADAAIAGWATPQSRDHKSGETGGEPLMHNTRPLSKQALGAITSSSPAATEKRGALASDLPRWLMGFPKAWNAAGKEAVRQLKSSRTKRKGG